MTHKITSICGTQNILEILMTAGSQKGSELWNSPIVQDRLEIQYIKASCLKRVAYTLS